MPINHGINFTSRVDMGAVIEFITIVIVLTDDVIESRSSGKPRLSWRYYPRF